MPSLPMLVKTYIQENLQIFKMGQQPHQRLIKLLRLFESTRAQSLALDEPNTPQAIFIEFLAWDSTHSPDVGQRN